MLKWLTWFTHLSKDALQPDHILIIIMETHWKLENKNFLKNLINLAKNANLLDEAKSLFLDIKCILKWEFLIKISKKPTKCESAKSNKY